jgi:hypothetical protein
MTLHKRRELMEDCNLWKIERNLAPGLAERTIGVSPVPAGPTFASAQSFAETFLEKRI